MWYLKPNVANLHLGKRRQGGPENGPIPHSLFEPKPRMPEKHKSPAGSSARKVIYIIGPRRLQNEAIASCLMRESGNECVVLEGTNLLLQEDMIDQSRPRLVLLDCQGRDPASVLEELRPYLIGKEAKNHVVFFNVHPDLSIERKCVLEGVRGFFYEQDPLHTFMKGVRAIFKGELWLSREVMTRCILEGTHEKKTSKSGSEILTPRQIEILALVSVGATNDEIADRLHLSPHTVKTHLYNVFKKINVPNRMQAALWAAKNL